MLKMFYFLLVSIVSDDKALNIKIALSYYKLYNFSLAILKIFKGFLWGYAFGTCWASWIYKLWLPSIFI